MKKDKDRYWDCLDQAMEASHGGRIDEALAWLDEALKAHPAGAEAHNGRGEILWDEGRPDEALYEFERAIAADAKFSAAYLNRVELLIEDMGECELALEACDELLAAAPELPRLDRALQAELYYLKAKALFFMDDLEGAVFLVRRAIKSAGDQPAYFAFEGHVLSSSWDSMRMPVAFLSAPRRSSRIRPIFSTAWRWCSNELSLKRIRLKSRKRFATPSNWLLSGPMLWTPGSFRSRQR